MQDSDELADAAWHALLADYDLRKGRLWPLVHAWILLGPAVVRARVRRKPRRGADKAGCRVTRVRLGSRW